MRAAPPQEQRRDELGPLPHSAGHGNAHGSVGEVPSRRTAYPATSSGRGIARGSLGEVPSHTAYSVTSTGRGSYTMGEPQAAHSTYSSLSLNAALPLDAAAYTARGGAGAGTRPTNISPERAVLRDERGGTSMEAALHLNSDAYGRGDAHGRGGGGGTLGDGEYVVTSVTEARTAHGTRVTAARTRGSVSPTGSSGSTPRGSGATRTKTSPSAIALRTGFDAHGAALASAALGAAYAYASG